MTDLDEIELLARAWKMREEIQDQGKAAWRQIQRRAQGRGLTTDELLRILVEEEAASLSTF